MQLPDGVPLYVTTVKRKNRHGHYHPRGLIILFEYSISHNTDLNLKIGINNKPLNREMLSNK